MNLYTHWITGWERRLTLRDPHRRMLPFSWGLEWLTDLKPSGEPLDFLLGLSSGYLANSEGFFALPAALDYSLSGDRLSFQTPLKGLIEKNNSAGGRLFQAAESRSAVVVVPQWNADSGSHVGLCRMLRRLGMTALRMTLPYHEARLPDGMRRADHMVGPNIGRTLHATRQAVLEVRAAVRWLYEQGYERVGVMGTSVGSCVSYLAFAHDPTILTGVFNHVSSYFGDVVWRGLSTRYVRWGLEGYINNGDLRRCWAPLSPYYFVDRLTANPRPHLLISARYDPTFPYDLTEQVFDRYRELELELETVVLPCGHYTVAHFPFKYLDGWHICRYLRKRLIG